MRHALDIILISSGSAVALMFVLQWAWERFMGRRSIGKAARDTERVYDVLRGLVSRSKISRGLVVKVHNGGDNPTVHGQLYATILQEVVTGDLEPLRQKYQKSPVDESYVRMMVNVHHSHSGIIFEEVNEMDRGMLRDVYIKSGVDVYAIGLIKTVRGASLILSLQWKTEGGDMYEKDWLNVQRAELRESVSILRKIF